MERVIESKKTKIVLVLLILLTMLSSYLPSITLAGTDDESEYVKFKSVWTSGTDEMDTLNNRIVYATFDMELSGSVVTGFRNVILKAEDFCETAEDENNPVAKIEFDSVAKSNEIINGSTSSTVEFESPLNAGTAISGDFGVYVSTFKYAGFDPFVKKIKVTLSGEYQDPITKEMIFIENIVEPKILTLNVTPEQRVTNFSAYLGVNDDETNHIITQDKSLIVENERTVGWYTTAITANYALTTYNQVYTQDQTIEIAISRKTDNVNKLGAGYNVSWGELVTDFGEPVKTTREDGADLYTFTKGTPSETYNIDNTFSLNTKVYNIQVIYQTENNETTKDAEKRTVIDLTAISKWNGWKITESAEGITSEKVSVRDGGKAASDQFLYSYTPGEHSWISVKYVPNANKNLTQEQINSFIANGSMDLTFAANIQYVWGPETGTHNGTIISITPTIAYYSDDKQVKTLTLSSNEMVLKSLKAYGVAEEKTLDLYNGETLVWQGKSNEEYVVPDGTNLKEFKVELNDFLNDEYYGGSVYNGYSATYKLSYQKLLDAGLSETEIKNIMIIEQGTKVEGTWVEGGDNARYELNDTDANKVSYLNLELGEFDCEQTVETKTISLSMNRNQDIFGNSDQIVRNVNPKIYVKLSKGFSYTLSNVVITNNPDVRIKKSTIQTINGDKFIVIDCEGTYDSTKLSGLTITVKLTRRLTSLGLEKNQSITAYMITDNENYFRQTGNIYNFSKGENVPNEVYYVESKYSMLKTDSVEISTGIYEADGVKTIFSTADESRLGKDDPMLVKAGSTVKYVTRILNGSDRLKNIDVIARLPITGNKSITNKDITLDSTISLTNLKNIKLYTLDKSYRKREVASTNYTISYSNSGESDFKSTFDSDYSGYENGISDVKSLKIHINDGYTVPNGYALLVEYEMDVPNQEGFTGETAAVSFIRDGKTETTVLEPVAAYVKKGNPDGTVVVQKKYKNNEVGTAPADATLQNIGMRLVNIETNEPLVNAGTNAEGVILTNAQGIATFTEVPQGIEYKIEETTAIPGYKRLNEYVTVMIENGETKDITVENGPITATLVIHKKWADMDSQYGEVIFLVKSKETGNTYQVSKKKEAEEEYIKIYGVDNGTYEVSESVGQYGWYADPKEVVVNATTDGEEVNVELENKLGTASLTIVKTVPDGDSVRGLKFEIKGIGYVRFTNNLGTEVKTDSFKTVEIGNDYTLDPTIDVEISEDETTATIRLTDLYLGNYQIKEVDIPNIDDTNIGRYQSLSRSTALKEQGKEVIEELDNKWKIGRLIIQKTAKIKTESGEYLDIGDLSGFKVRITGTSYYGTAVDKIVDIDQDGNSRNVLLEIGNYTVTEVPADGYTPYYITGEEGSETQTTEPQTVEVNERKTVIQKIYNEHTGVGYVKVEKSLEGVTDPSIVKNAGIKFRVVGKDVAGGNVNEEININQIDIENNVAYGISGKISTGGDYQLEEVLETVPDYYEGAEPTKVELTTANTLTNPLVMNVENKKTKGNLEISTQTNPVGGPLSGITYRVTEVKINEDGTYIKVGNSINKIGDKEENAVISAINDGVDAGVARLTNIYSGNYLVEQVDVPEGWQKDVNQIVEVPSYGTGYALFEITKEQEILNTKVIVNKEIVNEDGEIATIQDFVDAELREDESFEVKLTNVNTKQEYFTFISSAQKGTITGILPGTYEVEETYKPKYKTIGYYKLTEGIAPVEIETNEQQKREIVIENENSVVELKIRNSINTKFGFGGQKRADNYSKYDAEQEVVTGTTKSILYIVDEKGDALPGAQFKLLDSNGQDVVLGTSENNTYTTVNKKIIIKGLPVGDYTLRNTSVPAGYLQPEDKKFTVYSEAVRVARVEIQKNIPRGSLTLSTTYKNVDGETKYVARSKYKVVNPETGELLKFTKTLTGDYKKSELEDAQEEINVKSGTVEVTGIEVGSYEVGLTDVTLGYGMQKEVPEVVNVTEGTSQTINVEVIKNGIKQISAGYYNTMYLDDNGELWIFGNNNAGEYGDRNIPIGGSYYGNVPHKIEFPEGVKIVKFGQGEYHVVALDSEGRIWTWGYRNDSYLFNSTGCDVSQDTVVPVCMTELEGNPLKTAYDNGEKFVDIGSLYIYSIVLTSDGKIWTWGYRNDYMPTCITDVEGTGVNEAYNNGIKAKKLMEQSIYSTTVLSFIDSLDRVWRSDDKLNFTCISEEQSNISSIRVKCYTSSNKVDYDGNLYDGNWSKYDNALFNNRRIVYCNDYCALDETGDVWKVTVANSTVTNITENVDVPIVQVSYSSTDHIIMLGEDNSLYGYGNSGYGQCGIVGVGISNKPNKINIEYTQNLDYNISFEQIDSDYAIDNHGKLWFISEDSSISAFGNNAKTVYARVPNVSDEVFTKIKGTSSNGGSYAVLGVTKSGKLYSFGYGAKFGESNFIGAIDITSKFELEDDVKIVDAYVRGSNGCVIDSRGRVWTFNDTNVPPVCLSDDVDEPLYNVKIKKISCEYSLIMALDENGKIWGWNDNYHNMGITDVELNLLNGNETVSSPICLSDMIGTRYHELYKNNIIFTDITADGASYNDTYLLDNYGKLWTCDVRKLIPKYNQLELRCISDTKGEPLYNLAKNNEDFKIEKIECLDYGNKVFIKDNKNECYLLSYNKIEKMSVKNVKDVSRIGYIDEYGQIFKWGETTSLMTSAQKNPLYNIKIKNIISKYAVEADTLKGEIYNNLNNPNFIMYGSNYIEKYLGIELEKVYYYCNSDGSFSKNLMYVIDKNGKLWASASNVVLVTKLTKQSSSFIPYCISDVEGTELNAAYKNDPNFKLIDVIGNYTIAIALDNYGKIWTVGTNSAGGGTDKFICISDISGTALNNKYVSDSNYKISEINIISNENYLLGYSFVDNNGDTWVWGSNVYGQMGNGTKTEIKTPYCLSSAIGVKIKKIYAASNKSIIFIDINGNVWTCGNSNYILGTTTQKTTPTQISNVMTNIDEVYINKDGTCAIAQGENEIWMWGLSWINEIITGNTEFARNPIKLNNNFIIEKVIFESDAIEILDSEGKLWMFGMRREKQYDTVSSIQPICVSDDNSSVLYGKKIVNIIEIGNYRVLIDSNGDYYKYGGAGINSNISSYYNVVNANNIKGQLSEKIITQINGNSVLDTESKLYKIGGINITSYNDISATECITDKKNIREAYVSSNNVLINTPIKNQLYNISIKQIINNQIVLDVNDNYWYFPENGPAINLTEKINNNTNSLIGKEIVDVINTDYVVTSENEIYYIGGEEPEFVMKNTQGINIDKIYGMDCPSFQVDNMYYLVLDKSGKIWTCGSGRFGKLGNSSCNSIHEPICISDISGTDFGNAYKKDENFKIESVNIIGRNTTGNNVSIIALDNYGKIWTWGYNGAGQLGNGTTLYSTTPICISNIADTELKNAYNDPNFKIMSIHYYDNYNNGSIFALDNNGKLWAWGYNSNGQLGNGTKDNIKTPTCISNIVDSELSQLGSDFKIVKIKSTHYFTLILGNNGKIYVCCSKNKFGFTTNQFKFTCLDNSLEGIVDFTCNINSVIAYSSDTVWYRTTGLRKILENVSVKQIIYNEYLSDSTAVILDTNGKIWTFGDKTFLGYQLPEGTSFTYTPECLNNRTGSVLEGKNIVSISCYDNMIIAIDSDNVVYEWGNNIEPKLFDRFDTAIETIYGSLTAENKVKFVKNYYSTKNNDSGYNIKENGAIWSVNYSNGECTNILDSAKELVAAKKLSTITEVLDETHIKTEEDKIYKINDDGSFTYINEYTPSTEQVQIVEMTIAGVNIVARTKNKALDDQGKLYVWDTNYNGGYNSYNINCITDDEYVVEPIYSSGSGWSVITSTY